MKSILTLLVTIGLSSFTCSGVTFNFSINFGGSAVFSSTAVAYLVANGTGGSASTLTTISDHCIPTPSTPGAFLSTGDVIGDYVVFEDSVTTTDFGGGAIGFTTTSTAYDTSSIDSDIVAGTDLGIIIVDGTTVYGFSGSDTPDSTVGSNIGWEIPSESATNSLADISTDIGGNLSFPSALTTIGKVADVVPEPTTSSLTAFALLSLIARRKR